MPVQTLNILVVEDDAALTKNWRDELDAKNKDKSSSQLELLPTFERNDQLARTRVARERFDIVIVDLGLGNAKDVNDTSGNELIRFLLEEYPIPIAVHTGKPNTFDNELKSHTQIKVFDKGEGLSPVVDWIVSGAPMMKTLRDALQSLDREVARLFFKSIWPRWSNWVEVGATQELTNSIARHIASHTHSALSFKANQTAHAEESYFVPPILDRLDTGDLFEFESEVWILVTPRCDLANLDADITPTLLLAKCKDESQQWNVGEREKKNLRNNAGNSLKKHFLHPVRVPSGAEKGPWLVLFTDLKLYETKNSNELLESRFASLTSAFVPSLVERFGAFYSRIGTPNHQL
jgi:CheY-like chemotaxis protein